jgi:tripartite-type tricarboxylate transporter receptor subunit TctC
MKKLVIRLSMLLLATTFFGGVVNAQSYPTKPIKYIVPFPPGGPLDVLSRILTPFLSESLGQPVVVENIAGANASIGLDRVAKAAPDGYTIGLGNTGGLAINAALYGDKLPYNPVKDFSPLSMAVTYVNILVVDPNLPIKSVADLVAYAKANPNKVSFGSAGNGSSNHLSGELLKSLTGAPMEHVPYKGSAAALTDVIAGRLTFMFDALNTSMPQIRAGRVRALAVTSSKRSQYVPDVPTMAESGVQGYAEAGSDLWFGVVGPAGLPRPVVEKLNQHLVRILNSPEMAERVKAQFLDVRSSTPEEFQRVLEVDNAKWSKIVKASGARVD